MDWLRRNWPDLLIGVALVAVIAGIIATLISGGSFFPVGQGARNAGGAGTSQSTPVVPAAPTLPSTPTQGANGTDVIPDTTGQTAEPGAVGQAEGVDGAATGATGQGADQTGSPIAVLPPSGTVTTTPPASGSQTNTPAATTPATTAPATTAPATTTPATTAPAATTPATSTPTTAPAAANATAGADQSSYRVSVGAFGNADNAQRLAATFQSAGYPVLLGTQGNLTIVLVGPYETEAQARSVANAIEAGNFGVPETAVYRYDPNGGGAGATGAATAPATSTPAASAPAASTPAASTPTPATTPAPVVSASAAGRYLQVGAYGTRDSALPQIERLQGLGFQVTERTEGTLLKLLVGPYEGGALTDAQARLTAAGIESFAR